MEAISLKKMTLVVVLCTAGGFLVNANETTTNVEGVKSEKVDKASTDKALNAEKTKVEQKASPVFARLLKKSDTDKDGSLSKEELTAALDSQLIAVFDKIDTNQDKRITEQEFISYSQSPKS